MTQIESIHTVVEQARQKAEDDRRKTLNNFAYAIHQHKQKITLLKREANALKKMYAAARRYEKVQDDCAKQRELHGLSMNHFSL